MRDFWCGQLNIIFTTCCDATLLMKIIWDTFIKWGWLVGDQALVLTHVGSSVHYLGATCGLDIRLHRPLLATGGHAQNHSERRLNFPLSSNTLLLLRRKTDFHPPLQVLSKFFSASTTNLRPRPCTEGENPEKSEPYSDPEVEYHCFPLFGRSSLFCMFTSAKIYG